MKAQSEPVSRRARPAKAPLSRDVIVKAGLRILDRDGMNALTMRALARELDTGAASLYVYVRDREELLTLLLDEALGQVPLPTSRRGSWRKRLTTLVEANIAALVRHKGLAFVSLGRVPTGANELLIVDRMLALLREGGLDDETSTFAVDLLGLFVSAVAAEQTAYDEKAAKGHRATEYLDQVAQAFADLPAARYPMVASMLPLLLSGGGDERARWNLEVLLNGILATPAPRRR